MERRVSNHTDLAEEVYRAYVGYFAVTAPQVYVETWDDLDQDEQAAWHCAVASCVKLLQEGSHL